MQKENDNVEDRGGNHELFEHFMHSWVGYEIVKILLKYVLTPKIWTDLHEWSPQLHELFSHFEVKQRNTSDRTTARLSKKETKKGDRTKEIETYAEKPTTQESRNVDVSRQWFHD